MAAAHDRTQAEEACQRADELFAAGNTRGALRQARTAKRLCPCLPAAANAVAVYEIHAAALPGNNWRAVLGVPGGAAATKDLIKKQFRRLSLLVHPDKNGCAAAEGAFKLLRQAFDYALSWASHQPEAEEEEPDEGSWKKRKFREEERQRKEERSRVKPVPFCPFVVIICPFCNRNITRLRGRLLEEEGTECKHCFRWVNSPWQKKPDTGATTSEPEMVFPCSVDCPECGARHMFIVSVGEWCLRCTPCGKNARVNVQGPNQATATKTGRGT